MKKVVAVLSFVFLFLVCLPAALEAQQTIRVNAGGSAYRDSKGQTWSADYGFNAGSLSHSAPLATHHGFHGPYAIQERASRRCGRTRASIPIHLGLMGSIK